MMNYPISQFQHTHAWKIMACVYAALLLLIFSGCTKKSANPEITVACGANGLELDICKEAVAKWSAENKTPAKVISAPTDSNERLALYQQYLAAQSSDVDVLQIDVVWPGILANHLLDLTNEVPDPLRQQHFPTAIQNNTVGGKLVALPWFMDAGLLYYRKDLLEKHGEKVPQTWDELQATAEKIMKAERAADPKSELWGFVFQGRAYEGLTCDALEWIASFEGGSVVEPDGTISVNNPKARQAIAKIASFVGTIAPKGVLNYAEEESRGAFQTGQAIFMRNWPYAWGLIQQDQKIKDKVGIAPLPGGVKGKTSATLGGWGLAVSRYSKKPKESAMLIQYLTSAKVQKERFLRGAFNPTIPSLYDELTAANPVMALFKQAFSGAVARPAQITAAKYNKVSSAFWTTVHQSLSHPEKTDENFVKLEKALQELAPQMKW